MEFRETEAQTTTRFLFCDHGNTESTAEIKDAPSGADSCHCCSGSNRRNGTDVSVTSSRSVRLWCLVLAVSWRRRNATVSEIIPSCGRSGAWLWRWSNGDFIYQALLGGWPAWWTSQMSGVAESRRGSVLDRLSGNVNMSFPACDALKPCGLRSPSNSNRTIIL